MTLPVTMEQFENAVHEWFQKATGLESAVWRAQSAPEPEYPFGSLGIVAGPIPMLEKPEVRLDTDETRPRGQEVSMEVLIPCKITVSAQVFVGMPDARNPGWNSRTYLVLAFTSLSQPSVRETFWASGVTIIETGQIQNLDAIVESEHVSRSNLDVTFGVVLSSTEYTGFIEKVHITSDELRIDRDFGVGA